MKRRYIKKEWIIIFSSIFIFSALALALGEDKTVRVQGLIMELDLKKNIVVVNEKIFIWNQKTVFHNEKGTPINSIDRLKLDTWVYIIGEFDGMNKAKIAKEIYFLPKYIDEKERHLYPFIR